MIFKIKKYLDENLTFYYGDLLLTVLLSVLALYIRSNNDSTISWLALEGFLVLPLPLIYRRVLLLLIFITHLFRTLALNFGYTSIKVGAMAAIENFEKLSSFQLKYILIGILALIFIGYIYIKLDKTPLFKIKTYILIMIVVSFSGISYALERIYLTSINLIGSEIIYVKNIYKEDISENISREISNKNFRNSLNLVNGDNYYLFIVESFGVFKSKKANDYLFSIFKSSNIHNLELSTTDLTGAGTVGGEVRELCSKAIKHSLIRNDFFKSFECAPNLFKKYKYTTIAIHPGSKSIFNRPYIYKKMGFDHYFSAENLTKYNQCGGGWSGAPCDFDVINDLNGITRNFSQPKFVYYLTINTHYPYKETRNINGLVCSDYGINDDLTCKHFVNLVGTLKAIQKFSLNSSGIFYVVGDHAPPMLGYTTEINIVPTIRFKSVN